MKKQFLYFILLTLPLLSFGQKKIIDENSFSFPIQINELKRDKRNMQAFLDLLYPSHFKDKKDLSNLDVLGLHNKPNSALMLLKAATIFKRPFKFFTPEILGSPNFIMKITPNTVAKKISHHLELKTSFKLDIKLGLLKRSISLGEMDYKMRSWFYYPNKKIKSPRSLKNPQWIKNFLSLDQLNSQNIKLGHPDLIFISEVYDVSRLGQGSLFVRKFWDRKDGTTLYISYQLSSLINTRKNFPLGLSLLAPFGKKLYRRELKKQLEDIEAFRP